jgi:hypothetical protein
VPEWQERLNQVDPANLTPEEVERLASAQEALAIASALANLKAHVDSIPADVRAPCANPYESRCGSDSSGGKTNQIWGTV